MTRHLHGVPTPPPPRPADPCTHWMAQPQHDCGRLDTHLYPIGPRCPDHTPAAIAGRPEPPSPRHTPVRTAA